MSAITVHEAGVLLRRHELRWLILVGFDGTLVETATFGRELADKVHAARLGPILTEAAGVDVSQLVSHEDFRDGSIAIERDRMRAALAALVEAVEKAAANFKFQTASTVVATKQARELLDAPMVQHPMALAVKQALSVLQAGQSGSAVGGGPMADAVRDAIDLLRAVL